MTKLEKARIRLCSERICAELSDTFNFDLPKLKAALDSSSEMELLAWIFATVSAGLRGIDQVIKNPAWLYEETDEFEAYYLRCCEEFDDMLNGRVCKPEKIRKGVEGS